MKRRDKKRYKKEGEIEGKALRSRRRRRTKDRTERERGCLMAWLRETEEGGENVLREHMATNKVFN